MNILDRYLFRTVANATLVTLLVLLLLESFLTMLVELKSVGKGNYDLWAALHYLLLMQPQRLCELFPMALLVGSLLGMGGLASGSELIVMRAAGLSLTRLVSSVAATGLLLSLLVVLVAEFIAPPLEQTAREQRALLKGERLDIRGGRGFWARDGDTFLHIQSVLPGVRLANIHAFQVNAQAQLEEMLYATGARYDAGHWVLEDIARSKIADDTVRTERLLDLKMTSAISPQILEVLATNPERLSIRNLSVYISYLERNGLDAQSYHLAFWRKILAPLTSLAMLAVAMPFVFGPQRRAGIGQRLLIGLLLGLAFFLANYLLGNIVLLYGSPPLLGAALPTLLFLAAGFTALHRLR